MSQVLTICFFCILFIVTWMDIKTMEIEDWCWMLILVLSLAACIWMPEISWKARVAGFFIVSVPLLLVSMAIPGAFGGGDIKLMAASGAFLGWKLTLVSTCFAFLGGGMWAVYLLLSKKKGRKDHFAFGPFLCLGMLAGWLWGDEFLQWYLGWYF